MSTNKNGRNHVSMFLIGLEQGEL